MKKILLSTFIGSALLIGCAPAVPKTNDSASSLMIEKTVVSSEQSQGGAYETKAYLIFTGAHEEQVLLDDTTAQSPLELNYVDPAAYQNTDVIAGFTHYFAGGGYDIAVRRVKGRIDDLTMRATDGTIVVLKRATSEGDAEGGGGCGEWEQVTKFSLPSTVEIAWKNLGTPAQPAVVCGGW